MTILLRILVSAAALGVAAWVVPGIVVAGHGDTAKAGTLLVVAIIFGIINMLLKPGGCAHHRRGQLGAAPGDPRQVGRQALTPARPARP